VRKECESSTLRKWPNRCRNHRSWACSPTTCWDFAW
jgi:hypothetical protein